MKLSTHIKILLVAVVGFAFAIQETEAVSYTPDATIQQAPPVTPPGGVPPGPPTGVPPGPPDGVPPGPPDGVPPGPPGPPHTRVPDGGGTLALLGLAFAGLAALSRKRMTGSK
jgi:hypothetical protein